MCAARARWLYISIVLGLGRALPLVRPWVLRARERNKSKKRVFLPALAYTYTHGESRSLVGFCWRLINYNLGVPSIQSDDDFYVNVSMNQFSM